MRILNLQQNSPDWLEWRQGGIGASDVPIILSESPFKKPFQLWLEKTGRVPKPKPTIATAHGQLSEDTARQQLEKELGVKLEPISVVDDEAPYLRASYDGWNGDLKLIGEIKCPMTPKDHRQAKEGEIPWYYRLQCYQQMHIARVNEMLYYSWYRGEGIQLRVKLDEEFWFGVALPMIQEFWRWVEENAFPMPNGETVHGDSPELRQAAGDWFQAEMMRQRAEYCQRIAEAVYIRAAGNARNFISGGIQCQQQVWRPRYMVQVLCDDPDAQARVLKACSSLEGRQGVKEVKTMTWEERLVQKFTEVPEK